MSQIKKYKYTGSLVLGMHDALVEISGIIAGLAFAFSDRNVIIMTAAIAAVAASLSMAAANFQAQRTENNPDALRAAIYTGIMYITTSTILILPFMVVTNRFWALGLMAIMAVLIIFGFNCSMGILTRRPFMNRFLEMLGICAGVSIASFAIGAAAKYFMGITI
ncbi:MAG: VIT1/CCC1 transporter family protein [Lachnospiraceae bacterium]|nr:VIT1/CCC1 transporter family protein [Lachnospiraceae bacterium]